MTPRGERRRGDVPRGGRLARLRARLGVDAVAYVGVVAAALVALVPAVLIARSWHGQRVAAEGALRDKMLDAAQMIADAMVAERGLTATFMLAPAHGSLVRPGREPLRLDELVTRTGPAWDRPARGDTVRGMFRVPVRDGRPDVAAAEATGALRDRRLLGIVLGKALGHEGKLPESFNGGVSVASAVVDGRELTIGVATERTLAGAPVAVFGAAYGRARSERRTVEWIVKRLPLLTSTFGGVDWRTAARRAVPNDSGVLRAAPRKGDVAFNELLLIEVVGHGTERIYRTEGRPEDDWATPYVAEFALEPPHWLRVRVALPRAHGDRLVAATVSRRSQYWLLVGVTLTGLAFVAAVVVEVRRQRQLAEARRAFVSAISHELRTPLAHVAALSETLLVGGAESPEQERRWLGAIQREAHRLGRLVENVLLHERRGHGALPLDRAWVDVAELVADVVASADAVARARAVRVRADVPPICDAHVDAGAMRQILLNLVENAIKYGPPHQTVTVTVRPPERGRDVLHVTVDDEGSGVPPAHRERIWSAFERVGDRGGATGGSGLGLSVVRDLVAAHGGRAWVTEAPGGGARFAVELPQPPEGDAAERE